MCGYPIDDPEPRDRLGFDGHRDLVTGECVVRGVFARIDVETQQTFEWIHEFPVVGDKDVEFALRYQQRNGPGFDIVDPDDPGVDLTQVFGLEFGGAGSRLRRRARGTVSGGPDVLVRRHAGGTGGVTVRGKGVDAVVVSAVGGSARARTAGAHARR